ncbi:MAG: 4Fe-4S dicluster domain-containing protein [Candidatus Woesearchaeota archaeon]
MAKCIECGFCKNTCPIYRALLNESTSPRTKGRLKNEDMPEKVFYLCTLCDAHKLSCPIKKLELDIPEARRRMVEQGIETDRNKEMIENLRRTGNIYGKTQGMKAKG